MSEARLSPLMCMCVHTNVQSNVYVSVNIYVKWKPHTAIIYS